MPVVIVAQSLPLPPPLSGELLLLLAAIICIQMTTVTLYLYVSVPSRSTQSVESGCSFMLLNFVCCLNEHKFE